MTNGDWLRSINNAELANFLQGINAGVKLFTKCMERCETCIRSDDECVSRIEKWLKSEYHMEEAEDRLGYKPLKSDNIELGSVIPLPDGRAGAVVEEVELCSFREKS